MEGKNALQKLNTAARMLAEAKTLNEVKQIRDIAEAARVYARAAKLGLAAYNDAAEVKVRAERKAGEMLARLERGKGGQPTHSKMERVENSEYREVLTDNEIPDVTAFRWQQMANLPEAVFEERIEELRGERPITSSGVLRDIQELKREELHRGLEAAGIPMGNYRVLYVDPPWRYNDSGVITESDNYGRAERHYPTLSIDELCQLPIKDLAEDNAVLFLWVTSPLLAECFQVIEAWGFRYKASFVWDKIRHNFGHYNSVRHEFLLICTRGSCLPDIPDKIDSVIAVERSTKHSEKPKEFRELIDRLYPNGARIELFAREKTEGWDTWGNE